MEKLSSNDSNLKMQERAREREERETTYSERMKYLISNLKEMIVKLISLCGGGTESDLCDKYCINFYFLSSQFSFARYIEQS